MSFLRERLAAYPDLRAARDQANDDDLVDQLCEEGFLHTETDRLPRHQETRMAQITTHFASVPPRKPLSKVLCVTCGQRTADPVWGKFQRSDGVVAFACSGECCRAFMAQARSAA